MERRIRVLVKIQEVEKQSGRNKRHQCRKTIQPFYVLEMDVLKDIVLLHGGQMHIL